MLQLKLKKASDDGKAKDLAGSSLSRQDAVTSTEDLGINTNFLYHHNL